MGRWFKIPVTKLLTDLDIHIQRFLAGYKAIVWTLSARKLEITHFQTFLDTLSHFWQVSGSVVEDPSHKTFNGP